jgi:hypothetical protein
MGLLGEDQPDPDGSSGSQAIKSVFDHLTCLRSNTLDLVDQRSQDLELPKVGDMRILESLPGAYGQEQTVERIIRILRQGLGHGHASWLLIRDERMWRGPSAQDLSAEGLFPLLRVISA